MTVNRRDPLWKSAREALMNEAASVHVSIDGDLADRLAWSVVEALRENVMVAESMWRETAEQRKRNSDDAWKLIREAAPFVNAVLCMTIEKSRADGTMNPALNWLATAGHVHEEKKQGEQMAREIQERLGRGEQAA